jgi:hypothetical protein
MLSEEDKQRIKSLLYELRRRVPIDESSDVYGAIVQVRLIESEYLNQELRPDQSADLHTKILDIQDFRWVPAKEIKRYTSYWNKPIVFVLSLVPLFLLLLYGFYRVSKWLWLKLRELINLKRHREPPDSNPPEPKEQIVAQTKSNS